MEIVDLDEEERREWGWQHKVASDSTVMHTLGCYILSQGIRVLFLSPRSSQIERIKGIWQNDEKRGNPYCSRLR